MDSLGIPDLLSNTRLQRNIGFVSRELTRSGEEVATGIQANLGEAVQGNPQRLYTIEREITQNATYATNITTASSRSELTQNALQLVQDSSQEIGIALLAGLERGDAFSAEFEARQARPALDVAVAALNTRFGDRTLFSGAAGDARAIASADDILADVAALTSGLTDPLAAIAAVETYFTDPGGFDTTGYLGSTTDAPAVEVADGVRIDYAVRADNADIKNALKGLVLGVVGSDDTFFAGSDIGRGVILRESAESSLEASDGIISLRADLGFAEEQIEIASTRNASEEFFLSNARNAIIAKDQFEAAAEFTSLEVQLQSIFSVTARLSQLNFVNFL